ncbi:hypothetical protein BBBOND_0208550 [Babesia bigemina]|uniref:Uncharacterized protein n=1 Tax=Babesia bigemina TaxID=5866 RepID=A0A061D4R9_BABBI|nr:hypothetical protein BBBOND_0208550 [Babesia bigemina]CDR95701.1 hypothetical protein BBBOND_0208550 [Babesia bigemina]|eukprot:XP_012767887.1 hypothetical protein BBBOND_0208550 [Babesia bigemina]
MSNSSEGQTMQILTYVGYAVAAIVGTFLLVVACAHIAIQTHPHLINKLRDMYSYLTGSSSSFTATNSINFYDPGQPTLSPK